MHGSFELDENIIAADSPPSSLPTNNQFLRPIAKGLTALSATLLSNLANACFV